MEKFIPRQKFGIPGSSSGKKYFLGHHSKALYNLAKLSKQINIIYELRDARAPFSSSNPMFEKLFSNTPRVVVYTKMDLSAIPLPMFEKWSSNANNNNNTNNNNKPSYMFVNLNKQNSKETSKYIYNHMIENSKEIVQKSEIASILGVRILIIGMPNVGKSTLINCLRFQAIKNIGQIGKTKSNNIAKTGFKPGVTKSISGAIKLYDNPNIFIYDTPGISLPDSLPYLNALTLCAIGSIAKSTFDPITIADYILFNINLIASYSNLPINTLYSKYLNYPTNDIYQLLNGIRNHLHRNKNKNNNKNKITNNNSISDNQIAEIWIQRWQNGKEHRIAFDDFMNPNAQSNWNNLNQLDTNQEWKKMVQHVKQTAKKGW